MSRSIFADLRWLPPPPSDFARQCQGAGQSGGEAGRLFRQLAGHALDENGLNRLARAIDRARADGVSLAPLAPLRLGLLSNATTHFLVPALVATAARHGLALECIEAPYGQAMQQALAADSGLHRAQPEAVLVAIDHHGLPLRTVPGDGDAATAVVAACLDQLDAIRAGVHAHSPAVCLMQTVARPVETLFGSFDFALAGTPRQLIEAINRGLAERLRGGPDILFDVAGLAETVGLADWHDPTLWNMAKVPFANTFLPLYADHVCRLLAALKGKSRRCLALDLDNTLWSGVIGDDGLQGIVIGQGDPTGEAYLAVQQMALALRQRGVVLAVSSKNDDATARSPFRQHPEMLLKEEHFAVFQANWDDKATNIEAIAAELSLGIDAMAFLDDNPVERGLVRELLPAVAIAELPDDPALYARTLLAAGYFEAIAFSAEDRLRSEFYQDNARRVALQKKAGDIDAYLASLAMVITFQPFDDTGRARIAQLVAKSNQFNLTTKRYTEAQIGEMEGEPSTFTLQVRLADCFGDNGMISVVICRRIDGTWEIDTWLMSCRVLGRKVERAVLQELARHGRSSGVRRLVGIYRPTERNRMVEDHYAKLGFALAERRADGMTVWTLDLDHIAELPLPMEVSRYGFATTVAG
jgi:FkbH-like protein